MESFKLIAYAMESLRAEGIDYFITGSLAAMAYSGPRMTHDVDVVVRINESQLAALARHFPSEEWYFPETTAREAIRRHQQFNIIHVASGFKLDLMIPPDDDFNRSRFSRVQKFDALGYQEERFASAEDVILKKLVYFKIGESDKHVQDVVKILINQGDAIDRAYLRQWAKVMNVSEILEEILTRAAT